MNKLLTLLFPAIVLLAGCSRHPTEHVITLEVAASPAGATPMDYRVLVDGKPTSYDDLTEALRIARHTDPAAKVRLVAAADTTYEYFAPLVISCAMAGFEACEMVGPDGKSVTAITPKLSAIGRGPPPVQLPAQVSVLLDASGNHARINSETVDLDLGQDLQKRLAALRHDNDACQFILRPHPHTPASAVINTYRLALDAGIKYPAFAFPSSNAASDPWPPLPQAPASPAAQPDPVGDPAQQATSDLARHDGWAPHPSTNMAPPSGGAGPKSSFYGTGGGATRIVYILANSDSMVGDFDYLRRELKRSVNTLLPIQQFGVIVLSEQVATLTNMIRATSEANRDIATKIDALVAQGPNDHPLAPCKDAFVHAFGMKPQLIYFVTNGTFDPKLVDELKALNKDRKVCINTIEFVTSADNAGFQKLAEQLKTLAVENGGTFRRVTEQDMITK